jgi:hypothetical protein
MGMNFEQLIYEPNFAQWARPVTFTPIVSQPAAGSIAARGIWHCDLLEEVLEDGSLFVAQRMTLDILESEFPVPPQQADQVTIPADNMVPAEGPFEVESVTRNGGGETTLALRKLVTAVP